MHSMRDVFFNLRSLVAGSGAALAMVIAASCGPSKVPCAANSDCATGEACVAEVCEAQDGGTTGTNDAGTQQRCTPGQVCRPSAGDCDLAETCGLDELCPPDDFRGAGLLCRPSAGPCDPDERCTGETAHCPADVLSPTTTVCRSAAGGCDVPETCTGTDAQCPQDSIMAAGEVCRPAAGDCDVEEVCNGTTVQCPADVLVAADTVCRAAPELCDIEEKCSGTDAQCPEDQIQPVDTTCRAGVNACDLGETCDGANKACPTDQFAQANTPCGAAMCTNGVATAARYCEGGSATCTAVTPVSCNGYQCNGTTCGTSCTTNSDCLSTHFCQPGNQCAPKKVDGQPCAAAAECVSGTCTASYVDGDGDGFGTGAAASFCGTAAPSGRALAGGDCCDSDTRAQPGQTTFFTTANACGSFDFDCNGASQKQYVAANACNVTGSCAGEDLDCDGTTGWSGSSSPACGATATYVTFCGIQVTCGFACNGCFTCNASTQSRTQGCR